MLATVCSADYNCTFVLRSLSDKAEDVQVGFPVDSEFARQTGKESSEISPKESKEWVLEYSFIARDEKSTYTSKGLIFTLTCGLS